jgi:hypothetical protein
VELRCCGPGALLYNKQEGYLQTFRPDALPARDWMESAARNLARLIKAKADSPPV